MHKPMRSTGVLIVLIMLAWLAHAGACRAQEGEAQTAPPTSPAPEEDLRNVARGNARFGFDLYRRFAANDDGNIFFSPASISTAFAMTWAGARGQTETEMATALHYDLPQAQLHPAFAALTDALRAAEGDGIQINVANRLWSKHDETFLPTYLEVVKQNYGGDLQLLDFSKPAEAAEIINSWAAAETNDKVTDLISEEIIRSNPALVLTNAIYFKGVWKTPFEKSMTSEQPFRRADATSVDVPLMHNDELRCGYYEDAALQVASLPYQGDRLVMVVVLPRDESSFEDLESSLTHDRVQRWMEGLRDREVDLWLPRFTFRTDYDLIPTLKSMGMTSAFGVGADFSGMNGTGDLFITAAVHKAFVQVNEEGTEAAAATGIAVGRAAAMEKPVFRADRPFVFMIVDRQPKPAGNILFIGRVTNPKE